jgi:hypothetical protein
MKTYNQFVTEAYAAKEELNEFAGALARGAARFVPGLQTAYGLYRGTSALMRGDKTGAALGYGSALPGPLGWGFAAADVGRDLMKGQPATAKADAPAAPTTPAASTPSASTPAAPKKTTVLAKKGGVEGVLDKATGKWTAKNWGDEGRSRYQTARGADQLAKDKAAVTGDKIRSAGAKYGAKAFSAQPKKEPAKQTPTAVLPAQAPSKLGDKTPYSKEATAKMSPRTQRILSGQSVYNRDPLARGTR